MSLLFGELSERSKEAVLKTVEVQASGGSNPSLSAFFAFLVKNWSDGRAVEGASLLRTYTGNGIWGSNPHHSANKTVTVLWQFIFLYSNGIMTSRGEYDYEKEGFAAFFDAVFEL